MTVETRPSQCARCNDGKRVEAAAETITPIEYVQEGYADRDDIIVWHGDYVITDVIWREEDTYTRRGYNVQYRWLEREHVVDKYGHCLRVEPAKPAYLRQQLHAIVGLIPDALLLEHLESLRCSTVWEQQEDDK